MPSTSDAVDQAVRLDQIGFPEFTSKLINDTFDALVSSMIRQEQSYADLVEKVTMSLEEFTADAVSDDQVTAWLSQHLPADDGGTVIRADGGHDSVTDDDAAVLQKQLGKEATAMGKSDGLKSGTTLDEDGVGTIRSVVARHLARPRQEALQELVQKGVVRVVVDDGTIHTDLDFHTKASQSSKTTSSITNKNTTDVDIGGYVFDWFAIAGSAKTHNVNVATRTSTNAARSSSDVDIQGHVTINVRGDYQPLSIPVGDQATPDQQSTSDD